MSVDGGAPSEGNEITAAGHDQTEMDPVMIRDALRRIEDNEIHLRVEESKPEGERSDQKIEFFKQEIEAGQEILDSLDSPFGSTE